MSEFTHLDAKGNAVMVDVSQKQQTKRQAIATGRIKMNPECYSAAKAGSTPKGDVLGAARIAGIMAVKQTGLLIPLCHTLQIEQASIDFEFSDEERCVIANCSVKSVGVTGVEMEALTGVSIALLTVYDMCKAIDKGMEIGEIYLVKKTGGKNGPYRNEKGEMYVGRP
ncbi:MAG: cyclic pyranopterin monophosphate synthase MoaC [Oscillospiraceae bacterium]|nr:cyclic pyranopterin monophosphate synthase MoaC [Oscillospiraceae bacterium]